MRKMILILLLAVVSSNAMAEWVAVNRSKYATGYANPATIVKDGNIAKMWSLVDCKTITRFIGGPPFMSIKSQEEFDCKEKNCGRLHTLCTLERWVRVNWSLAIPIPASGHRPCLKVGWGTF
jgi:hypothetical protein